VVFPLFLDQASTPAITSSVDSGAGEGYLPAGSPLDPCHGCVDLVARFDLTPDVFAPGVLLSPPPA
jgi:hypothetical protein